MTRAWQRPEAHAHASGRRHLLQLLAWMDRGSYYAILLTMGLMTILVCAQVVARYLLGTSIDSADELSRLCFVWAIFLAIPHGIPRGVHVGIDALVSHLPTGAQRRLGRLMAALGVLLMVVLGVVSLGAVIDKWPQLMPTMPVTAAVFYVAVLVSAIHCALHLLAQVLELTPQQALPGESPEQPPRAIDGQRSSDDPNQETRP
ncbi:MULTISPECIES: TRAP transporter small permease [unclassified Halomonas]|uniref:TRAP transporter small permease n=1 Tax=unclassified Halomonas TaxID=2609666 RepID=UPI001C951126|nr:MULTISPECIES: TRAP transporter small permease [unclassified Halomonas]MBY5926657.1 TRAP transporter small permease [Halomonas sp. DP4Y7-2]MBY6233630.1 TRAP transporter small permease [Halomonas sp. DP4Y7-1]